ncbi:MAG: AI-2E family transporter [Methyloceanibacter sp.]|jgi:AI-2 transport protein TqsA
MITDRQTRAMLAICTAILVSVALYFARSIFAPFAFALFMVAIVWPLQSALERMLPQFVALFITLFVTAVVLILFTSMVAWGFSVVAQWMIANAARFQAMYVQWTHWLEEHGIFIVGMISDRFDVMWLVRVAQTVAGRINNTVGFAILAFVFMMLALLEAGDMRQRLASLKDREKGRELAEAGEKIGAKFRKYMLVRTQLSALTGVAVWAFALLTGLELAAAWGIIAFALNYIPFLGPWVATILPALFAIAQFDSWQPIVMIVLGLFAIQFTIGNYLEPLVAGAALSISPLAVIFAVFFWSFLWGIPGAFIGVPITIAILTLCELSPSSRWIATLLSGAPQNRDAKR